MYVHIQCMNINIYVDVASDLIIFSLVHLLGFVLHSHMFGTASHSLDYDPESKLVKASQNKPDLNLQGNAPATDSPAKTLWYSPKDWINICCTL